MTASEKAMPCSEVASISVVLQPTRPCARHYVLALSNCKW
jgi:hypothetical protein